jgi:hypothetical protein
MKEIAPLSIRDYRLYVHEGAWKTMEPTRMKMIFTKMLTANWLSAEQKETVKQLIAKINDAKAHKALFK